ncbi:WG repeat-containing protein [bacterium]|nr:WG repeat-containing protein [bacterium]
MKKFIFIFFVLIFVSLVILLLMTKNLSSDTNMTKYYYLRWEKTFTREYTHSLKQKYPKILKYNDLISKNFETVIIDETKRDLSQIDKIYLYSPFEFKRNKSGLIGVWEKETGIKIIPQKYKYLMPCKPMMYGMFFIAKEKNITKLLAYNGDVLFEAQYDEFEPTYYGIQTEYNDRYGMVSYEGVEILKPEYDEIVAQEHFCESGGRYYIAKKDDFYTVVDNKGNTIIPLQNEYEIQRMDGVFFQIEKDYKKGVIDSFGDIVVKPLYDLVKVAYTENYNDSYFTVCSENKCGTIDLSGEQGLPLKFDPQIVRLGKKSYAVSSSDTLMRIVNDKGRRVSFKKYPSIHRFTHKYAQINDKGLGVINLKGKLVMKPRQDIAFISSASDNGLFLVFSNGKYGVIHKNKFIAEPIYLKGYFYKGHVMLLTKEGKKKYYYIASFKDFLRHKGKLNKMLKVRAKNFTKTIDPNCFLIKNEKGEEIQLCKSNNDGLLQKFTKFIYAWYKKVFLR